MKELYRFRKFINESIDYNSWVKPDLDTLKREFRVEHEYKNQNWFKNVDEFIKAVDNAEVVTITPSIDSNIEYRSKTKSYSDLINLLSTYNSWGRYRTEDTTKHLYNSLKNNKELDMPIVLRWPNGKMRIFSGNTRMDVAFQLGINPQVLMVDLIDF